MAEARDIILPESSVRRYRRGSSPGLPRGSDAGVGTPTRASAELGRRIFEFIKERIRSRVLGSGAPVDDT
jgi:hypothetical protein